MGEGRWGRGGEGEIVRFTPDKTCRFWLSRWSVTIRVGRRSGTRIAALQVVERQALLEHPKTEVGKQVGSVSANPYKCSSALSILRAGIKLFEMEERGKLKTVQGCYGFGVA